MKRILLIATLACMAAAMLTSCRDNQWDEHGKMTVSSENLLSTIKADPALSQFYDALVATEQDSLLLQSINFTVFAPSNGTWTVPSNLNSLRQLVRNHIAYEKVLLTDTVLNGMPLSMVNGKTVRYDKEAQTFNGAAVTSANNIAANGVLHITNGGVEVRQSVWEYAVGSGFGTLSSYFQASYLYSLGTREMDMQRSVQVGVNERGLPVYDTVWLNFNPFLREVPLDNELQEYTIIVLQDVGFSALVSKFRSYLKLATTLEDPEGDMLTNYNVCRDLVFAGSIDVAAAIAAGDTLTSITGVKVAVGGAQQLLASYQASNGRVYVLDNVRIPLSSKIKPVRIEGENFASAYNKAHVYTRYRPDWASGAKDIMLSCSTVQYDTLLSYVSGERDSIVTTTFGYSGDNLANATNFWLEYKAEVFSANYEIHYVAYNDIAGHYADPLKTMRLEQKLFISRPAEPYLGQGSGTNTTWITNNYLGNTQCFVGQSLAGDKSKVKLRRWTLKNNAGQTIDRPVTATDAATLVIPRTGTMTMRLCNTPRTTKDDKIFAGTQCGMLFLDYIELVPILPTDE